MTLKKVKAVNPVTKLLAQMIAKTKKPQGMANYPAIAKNGQSIRNTLTRQKFSTGAPLPKKYLKGTN